MQGLLILSLALIMTLLATLVPGLAEWRRALTRRWRLAFLPLLALAATMLGSTEGASLGPGLPDPLRMVRAGVFAFLFLFALLKTFSASGALRLAGAGIHGMSVYGVLAIASAMWSIAPFITAWKGFEVLTLTLVFMALAPSLRSEDDAIWLSRLLGLALLYLCMTVLAGLVLYPSLAIKDPDTTYTQYYFAVRGLVPVMNPSTVGSVSALLFILSITTLLKTGDRKNQRRLGTYFSAAVAVAVMILAHSRTPIFACMLALILILFYARRWKLIFLAGSTGAILLLATSIDVIVQQYILRGQTVEAFSSLTGRIGFWEKVWEQASTSPYIGHGYYAGQRITFGTNSVDNTYLEVFIGLGLAGLAAFLFPLLWAAYRIYTCRPKSASISALNSIWLITAGFFTILVVRSVTGASFQVMHPLLVIYLIVLAFTTFLSRIHGREAARIRSNQQVEDNNSNPKQNEEGNVLRRRRPSNLLYGKRLP